MIVEAIITLCLLLNPTAEPPKPVLEFHVESGVPLAKFHSYLESEFPDLDIRLTNGRNFIATGPERRVLELKFFLEAIEVLDPPKVD